MSRSLTRSVAVLGMAGAVAMAGVPVAAPALAGPNCPSGYHCVMKDNIDDNQVHDYYSSDSNFTNDYFTDDGGNVNDNVSAASNSSTGGYESHYYYNIGYGTFAFCVNPGSYVAGLWDDGKKGNGTGLNDEVSSLKLRPTTSVSCF